MNLIEKKFTSLRHKNFRNFWTLEIFSLFGVWIQSASQSWLVYQLTDSPFLLGLVTAMQFMPVLLFSLFAGVIVDSYPKRKVLLITQHCLCIMAFILGALVLSGTIAYWHIIVFALILGVVNTFDMPARQSIIVDFVEKEDLMNAVSLNSTVFNVARMIGPAIAGILIKNMENDDSIYNIGNDGSIYNIGYCFIITAILYIPVILFLFRVKINEKTTKVNITRIFHDVGDGIKHILSKKVLYVLIFLVMMIGIFALNYSIFVPVLAKDVLKMDSKGYGNLMAALGLGAFLGSIFMSLKKKGEPSIKIIMTSVAVVSVLLILSGYATSFISAAILLALTGFFNNIFFTNANSMLMLNSDDEFRGRVMSIYTLAFGGTSPIGNLFSGTIIDKFSVKSAFLACGFSIIIIVSVFLVTQSFVRMPKPSSE